MNENYLSAYYFHGQDLCMVPRHVREDVAWMKDHAVDGVFVGVHDSDLLGGNTDLVCRCIREAGLDLWLIPSRIGGLMAGWHRGPSVIAVNRPDLWARTADGDPRYFFGPQFSPFHQGTPMAVAEVVLKMIDLFSPSGIVWDELKTLDGEDYSDAAKEALGGQPAQEEDMLRATVACFGTVNNVIKERQPDLTIACFIYANSVSEQIEACASIPGLNQFGCDGKCFRPGESQAGEGGDDKVLLGGVDSRFRRAAAERDLESFTLLETQLLGEEAMDLTLRRLPEFLSEKTGHLAFYYYPYGMENPERYMPAIGESVMRWRL